MDCAWRDLPLNIQQIILQGSKKEKVSFSYVDERGNKRLREQPFDGFCHT